MGKRHQFFETELTGRVGVRFLSEFLREKTGMGQRPGVTVTAIPEYGFLSSEKPPGNQTHRMWLDLLYVLPSHDSNITIGVEVKVNENDLLFGEKLHYQLGITDYLFLAVPRTLIPCARYVIKDQLPEDTRRIGLIDLTDGDIAILPVISPTAQSSLITRKGIDLRHITSLNITNSQRQPKVHFQLDGELVINNRYAGLLALQYKPSIPPRSECFVRFHASPRFKRLLQV